MNTDETPNPDGKDAAPPITLIEINNHLANLSDQDRAEAFYDLAVNGFSLENESGDDGQNTSHLDRSVVLAAIAGWTIERASLALYNFESKLIAEQVAQGESAAAHEFTD